MLLRLASRVGTRAPSRHVRRLSLGSLAGASFHLRRAYANTTRGHHRSVLSLVHSAINLALPSGPFDDRAVAHRASSNDGSVPFEEEERLLPMFLRSTPPSSPVGFLRPSVVKEILKDHHESSERSIWNVLRRTDGSSWAVCFADHIIDVEARTRAMRAVADRWRAEGRFPDILKGWSGEVYPVYTPRRERVDASSSLAFGIERAALPLFGFANFGCLLTAFYDCRVTGKTMLWIPRRSPSKSTWPGRYDCTAGGGMGVGETPHQTIVRECAEEASFPPDFVKKHARPTGMLNYMNRSPSGWLLPGIYYLYELRLPDDGAIIPRTNAEDGEVDAFQLMDIDEVMERLLQGRFKPSSAMALVDFCTRRGIIAPESDSGYLDICMAIRGTAVLPLP